MLQTTLDAIRSILQADPGLEPAERITILQSIRNKGREPKASAPVKPAEPRLLRRNEVARRLGRSLRCVDKLAREGLLTRVKLPGRTRAVGFREADVCRLIEAGG